MDERRYLTPRNGRPDIWHRLGRIFRLQNLGTLLFFLLNVGLMAAAFCPYGVPLWPLAAWYAVTVLISLSPVGEWLLCLFAGAREIKRLDVKVRLIPLLEVVFADARRAAPWMPASLRLKIIYDDAPNAYAVGRRTICVTSGILTLTDDEIMALFAHELGHIAYGHSTIQLLIGGGNVLISGCLLVVKLICWAVSGLLALMTLAARQPGGSVLAVLLGGLSSGLIWLWTRFCLLFLRWSMRQNELDADAFACRIGYGWALAALLDSRLWSPPPKGLLRGLYDTHPDSDERIARLQELGVNYARY